MPARRCSRSLHLAVPGHGRRRDAQLRSPRSREPRRFRTRSPSRGCRHDAPRHLDHGRARERRQLVDHELLVRRPPHQRHRGFECALDAAVFAACTSPATITTTAGAYTFYVRAYRCRRATSIRRRRSTRGRSTRRCSTPRSSPGRPWDRPRKVRSRSRSRRPMRRPRSSARSMRSPMRRAPPRRKSGAVRGQPHVLGARAQGCAVRSHAGRPGRGASTSPLPR